VGGGQLSARLLNVSDAPDLQEINRACPVVSDFTSLAMASGEYVSVSSQRDSGNASDWDERLHAGDLRPWTPMPPCGEAQGMAGPGGTISAALAAPVAETPPSGLSGAEVAERRARGLVNEGGERTSRSVAEILRANILTRFNFILGTLLAVILVAGQPQDALFGIVLVTNALIGIGQELRAKRTLDRLAVLSAPRVQVIRDGTAREI